MIRRTHIECPPQHTPAAPSNTTSTAPPLGFSVVVILVVVIVLFDLIELARLGGCRNGLSPSGVSRNLPFYFRNIYRVQPVQEL